MFIPSDTNAKYLFLGSLELITMILNFSSPHFVPIFNVSGISCPVEIPYFFQGCDCSCSSRSAAFAGLADLVVPWETVLEGVVLVHGGLRPQQVAPTNIQFGNFRQVVRVQRKVPDPENNIGKIKTLAIEIV